MNNPELESELLHYLQYLTKVCNLISGVDENFTRHAEMIKVKGDHLWETYKKSESFNLNWRV